MNILSHHKPLFYHGGVSQLERDRMIRSFQSPTSVSNVLILSLKCGGVGINLTAANIVFHFDLWWNPAVEKQATDRSYRIGQKRNVQVYRFITEDTIEEKIDELLNKKKAIAKSAVHVGEKWIGDMDNGTVMELLCNC